METPYIYDAQISFFYGTYDWQNNYLYSLELKDEYLYLRNRDMFPDILKIVPVDQIKYVEFNTTNNSLHVYVNGA